MTEALTTTDYQHLARFRAELRAFLRFSEDAARSAGVTPAHHQLMLAIAGWDGTDPPSIGDTATMLMLARHSASELVDRAAEAGLVERVADRRDGRRQRLRLTAHGDEVLATLSQLHRDELRRFREEALVHLRPLG